jgi:hypothetical protein
MSTSRAPDDRERAENFIEDRVSRLGSSPVKLAREASTIARALAAKDPDAYRQFVDDVAVEAIVNRLRSYLTSQRHAAVRAERSSVFRAFQDDTAKALETGRALPSPFSGRYSLPGHDNEWWALGSMTRPDLLAVSHHRAKLSRSNAVEAIFLAALAARLPDDVTTVAEAFTEDDVLALHDKAESAPLGELPTPTTTTTTDTDEDQP